MILQTGGLGGILTGIESVKEIGQMSKHPTNYPTSEPEMLKSLAKAATPGLYKMSPWHIEEGPPCVRLSNDPSHIIATTASDADAAFIAAANPAAILSLVESIEAQAARIAELERALKPFAHDVDDDISEGPSSGCEMSEASAALLGKIRPSDFRKARQAYTGDTTTDITSHESTAPYAHPYAKEEK